MLTLVEVLAGQPAATALAFACDWRAAALPVAEAVVEVVEAAVVLVVDPAFVVVVVEVVSSTTSHG